MRNISPPYGRTFHQKRGSDDQVMTGKTYRGNKSISLQKSTHGSKTITSDVEDISLSKILSG
jgi:hypothetical protein